MEINDKSGIESRKAVLEKHFIKFRKFIDGKKRSEAWEQLIVIVEYIVETLEFVLHILAEKDNELKKLKIASLKPILDASDFDERKEVLKNHLADIDYFRADGYSAGAPEKLSSILEYADQTLSFLSNQVERASSFIRKERLNSDKTTEEIFESANCSNQLKTKSKKRTTKNKK